MLSEKWKEQMKIGVSEKLMYRFLLELKDIKKSHDFLNEERYEVF